ncbi:hypothetical protein M1394_02810 [Candidatus Marsarchaeota archaeon]|nr:hypothetical protein [Candidatus Marsarchaeota archaeon]
MKYNVMVNKKYSNVRVYKIVKRVNESTNVASKALQNFIDKYIVRRKRVEV